MPDYQLGKIYRIFCNVTGLNYYGSTCEPTLARRSAGHRSDFKKWKNDDEHYLTSFECLINDNYEIVLVELFPCNSKMELHKRERFYIENNDCVNKIVPTRTDIEYRFENKTIMNKTSKKYYIENREQIIEKFKLYRHENKDKISEKTKEKYECECGSILTKSHHLRHDLSKKHIDFINNKTLIQHNILV